MYEKMRIKYLGLNLSYTAYLVMQVTLFFGLLLLAGMFYAMAHESKNPFLANAWWFMLICAGGEILETMWAISRAKAKHRRAMERDQDEWRE